MTSLTSGLVIFDLDGTLVDSMTPYTELFCEMLELECGIPDAVSRPVYTGLLGKGPRAQFAAVLRAMETLDEALVEDLTRRYWQRAEVHDFSLFPEVLEVLEGLLREGNTLIVSSGSVPDSVTRKLRSNSIERFFQLALGSVEDVPALAKGAGHFAMICNALSLTPDDLRTQAVFVGDGAYDMEVARAAGIRAIGRLTGDNASELFAAGANYVIEDLRGLPPLLHLR